MATKWGVHKLGIRVRISHEWIVKKDSKEQPYQRQHALRAALARSD
jgi:hypothetical protein